MVAIKVKQISYLSIKRKAKKPRLIEQKCTVKRSFLEALNSCNLGSKWVRTRVMPVDSLCLLGYSTSERNLPVYLIQ